MGLNKNQQIMGALVLHRDVACQKKEEAQATAKSLREAKRYVKSKTYVEEAEAWEVREKRYIGEIAWRKELGY